jgi:cytochrome c peroxidase
MLNHAEMGVTDLNSIVTNVKSMPYYSNLYLSAFGTTDININNTATALSSFVGSITSQNTRFDLFNTGINSLSALELQGQTLFFNKYNCNSCHQTQVLNGYQRGGGTTPGFINIGLDLNYADNGVGALNGNAADNGKFKIPNLRNVALTAPYMHDGRFATLDAVLEHYSHNIMNHPNLDSRLKDGNQAKQMNISDNDKTAIIAFLNTLTDYTMITDPKFSSPFITK